MNGLFLNQNIMIPAIFQGHVTQPQFQATDNICVDHANNQSNAETHNSLRQSMQFHGFQPFNITIANNNFYQQPMSQQDFRPASLYGTEYKQMKSCDISEHSNRSQCDVTSSVMSALHQSAPGNETQIVQNKIMDISSSYPQTARENRDESHTHAQHRIHTSPLGELRLPTIKTSSNVAANVMSEESDLGYCSFSDYSTFQEISDAISYSEGSNDEFDDVKANFSDLIDDVLDSIDKRDLIKTESATQDTCKQVKFEESRVLEPNQNVYEQNLKQYQPVPVSNYFEPLNIQTTHTFVPYMIAQNAYHITDVKQFTSDFYCHECDKCFQTKSSLRVHMRQHRGERPHQCPYCQKTFTQKSTLRTHIRTHTGERPYTCSFCARAFGDYSTFRKHVRVHTGEKPYTCDICNKSFTQSGNMIRHKEVHMKKSQIKK